MGCSISSVSPAFFETTECPSAVINNEKEGDVYLMVYADTNLPGDTKLQQNYSIVIDVAGESINDHDTSGGAFIPKGVEIYLSLSDGVVNVQTQRNDHLKPMFQSYKLLGKIENVYHQGNPKEWSDGLKQAAEKFFNEFKSQNGNQWNHQCNSHKFSKYLIEKLSNNNPHQLQFPKEIYIAGENDKEFPIYFKI
ncbi:hypothetical protein DICPUDRAFT_159760 [Dictyostelium purpureum]|uniref:Uncharacterized protein n=1 Tax=Dictyostelium purpureum TaxID=5786 RepID=F1A4X8_DICPU|nr:uncharacterized protein DICPUDRAFT_159760 [Dictyostelium purpureum]EGC28755.1 hypothetical protein DICPUDRAFT_159760 [Dictyostelium purpureum]|eukprot:XP_003294723.1 hypothetical protein DICPUDRAFT_159760 [Dictyostelium purpureum]